MKVNSISGIKYHVEDLSRTAEFYEAIGFRRGKDEPDRLTFYVNWFFVTFVSHDQQVRVPENGAASLLYIKVDDLDEFYNGVVSRGMNPETEPQPGPNRTREFMLRDPDGYKLVFFEKK
jgi:predicted enzyme related to lactoylglutathione lyase